MARTTESRVRTLLGLSSSTDVTAFIDTAYSVVTEVSDNDSEGTLDAARLELIERWLSAHFYKVLAPSAKSKGIGSANVSYEGRDSNGKGFESTQYGKQAMALDTTGFLHTMGKGKPEVVWMGEENAYENRREYGESS